MNQPTVTLHEARREYLDRFIQARRGWNWAKVNGSDGEIEMWHKKIRKYAALLDLNTRLQNEMKGRAKQ